MSLYLKKRPGGSMYKALYEKPPPPHPEKRCPFHILSKLAHIINKLQKEEVLLSFSVVPNKGSDTTISCSCSKYCNN